MAEDKEPFEYDELIQKWAHDSSKRMVRFIYDKGLDHTGALARSIQDQFITSGGDMQKVIFRFLAYGRFRDMGTGKGFRAVKRGHEHYSKYRNENGSLKAPVKRTPGKFYSKTMFSRIGFLQRKLLGNMSNDAIETIKARLRRIDNHPS